MTHHSSSEPTLPASRPLVLVPACNRVLGEHPFQIVGEKYVQAVRLAGALPVVVPSADLDELDQWLAVADGLFLTGSPSNVHPDYFDQPVHDPALPLDPRRDAWTLAAIPRALAMGLPILAVCRGFQEMNVALGGSLLQAVHEVEGLADHRAPPDQPAATQYDVAHEVALAAGGVLATLVERTHIAVNSLHGQGIGRLAPGLRVEARAPDGLIEAFSVVDASCFALGVQWHPEWRAADNPVSLALLHAFGAACQAYRDTHRPPSRTAFLGGAA